MKKTKLIMAGLTIAFAMVFTCSSCTKKEEAPKGPAIKESPKMTPEQLKRAEEIKKGVEASKAVVAARVNGRDITMFSLVREMNTVAQKIIPTGQSGTPELTAKVKKEALNNLIFRELALQEAMRQGMKVKSETIEDVISKVKAQAGSEEGYKKYLQDRNLDENGLRKTIERSHLLEMITAREIFDKIKVDDKVLRNTYEKDKASFMTKDNPSRQMSFEEAKGFIEGRIKSEIGEKRLAQWNSELRKKAKIEVMPDEVEQKLKEDAGKQKK